MVCQGGLSLAKSWMKQVLHLKRYQGIEFIWVSSGAIGLARLRTRRLRRTTSLSEKQALSALGQPLVMDLYNTALRAGGQRAAQILLTYDDLANRARRRNFQETVERLLDWNYIPIVNENDTIATEEIQFGDNDSLAARIAIHTSATRLVILTDVDGYYDRDPNRDSKARLIHHLNEVKPSLLKQPGLRGRSQLGTGGMLSKLLAARLATRHQIPTWLVRGDIKNILMRVERDEIVGTRIGGKP